MMKFLNNFICYDLKRTRNYKIKFKILDKAIFYLGYASYKLLIILDVKSPKYIFLFFELFYSMNKILRIPIKIHSYFRMNYLWTKFGKFYIRPGTEDMICVSPAFERRDLNYLFLLTESYLKKQKKVLFMDVGADFGTYSVSMGNRFRNYKDFDIISFEPVAISYDLLKKNIKINNLKKKIKTFKVALTDKSRKDYIYYDPNRPGSSSFESKRGRKLGVVGKRLESLKINYHNYDAIIIKIDVEGHESAVIKGSLSLLKSKLNIHLLIEDFKNQDFMNYLPERVFFDRKLTSYNSWWRI